MKRVYILLLAMLMVLTGCADKTKTKDVTVRKASCPYEIDHKKNAVEVTLHNGKNDAIHWNVEVIPEEICEVTQKSAGKKNSSVYCIAGLKEGVAQLVFSALDENETVIFDLDLRINVDSRNKVAVTASQHRDRKAVSIDEVGFSYRLNEETDGTLLFSFINDEDTWLVTSDGDGICSLTDIMITPSGCVFRIEAIKRGKTTIQLEGETTQRKILVAFEVDGDKNVELVSVLEQ